ncbi:iron-containing alcohol dehydrogenase [Pseudomonas sp. CBSPBW29]|uniref:iron-containing alcohol dehydrogenase n=1 Tax=Pseudomonas sp. CBS TaxID=2971912 RepID=UPI0021AD380F|nr:iron-containing alcohol dehydrogenase [Pseudomonas sp. CBS]WEL43508.1 iron-containing alcohol dehydrogenase [Pseudomonas sp. CBSPBW29]WEL64575.1 iron-containing alcohol dehydrogenase [Pseudomonas sp. CBSPGW29]WEL68045.1 iron-containing alcohol dehydrogenase [Pseudomonas sp. CBSPCGW29]WEL75065.1 iron-containing alcohol dehydrogenase [Pseudomonas sp. CBSPAW29]WEL80689.1 iron-containing alcohol dehydrogenase [Pseudomonas sp. CBSPCAW29]WEL89207.1 iron-containing alcohol dehydrogenase [Pseudomo
MPVTYHFQTVKHLIHGAGSLDQLSAKLELLDTPVTRVILVTQNAMHRLGVTERVIAQLQAADISVHMLDNVEIEPTLENIERVFREDVAPHAPDALIAIGGGSVLDAAKLFAVMLTNDTPLRNLLGIDKVRFPGKPMVLVPTTSGTGSEVTPNAIVTLPDEELKIGVVSRHLLPTLVLLDPLLTLSLPKPITAATGMDAFTHSLESFISTKANPVSDAFALESMRLISGSIVTAYEQPDHVEARSEMLLGSMYGGLALTAAGTAAVHALAYPLGGKFHVTHGVANAMLLPHVMAFNLDSCAPRLKRAACACGVAEPSDSDDVAAHKLIAQISQWTQRLNIPQDLRAFGVSEEHLADMAVAASKVTRLMANNPKPLTLAEIEQLYRCLLP